jgi:hypothetical protein
LREGRIELDAAKQRLGTFGYACQYQRNPIARGGNLFKTEWFNHYRDMPAKFDERVMSLDCPYKAGATADYSAAVIIGHIRTLGEGGPAPGYYVLNVWRGKVESAASSNNSWSSLGWSICASANAGSGPISNLSSLQSPLIWERRRRSPRIRSFL